VKRSRGALSLLEITVTTAIFGALMLVMLAVFDIGTSLFASGSTRLELQNELRRIQVVLQTTLRNSNFNSVSVFNATQVVPLHPPKSTPTLAAERFGLCFNSLSDTQDPNRYDATTGLPRWDCYDLFWASLDIPDGKMIFAKMHDPTPYSTQAVPLPGFSSAVFSLGNTELVAGEFKILSSRVLQFGCSLDTPNQLVHIRLSVRSAAKGKTAGGKSLVESASIEYAIRAENTWPRL